MNPLKRKQEFEGVPASIQEEGEPLSQEMLSKKTEGVASSALEASLDREVKESTFEDIARDVFNLSDSDFEKALVILKKNLLTSQIVQLIQLINKKTANSEYIDLLFVIFGIKPCYADMCSLKIEAEYTELITNLSKIHPNLKFEKYAGHLLFSNNKPQPFFDPAKFLKDFQFETIHDALKASINPENDQYLSYLLGYGPTWHCYAHYNFAVVPETDVFSDEHYRQLGTGFAKKNISPKGLIKMGKEYQAEYDFDSTVFDKATARQYNFNNRFDAHSLKTEYLQTSMHCRARIFKLFDIKVQ